MYPPDPPSLALVSLAGKSILLAEDLQLNQFLIARQLLEEGVLLDTVSNGAQAVERCRQKEYDLIILDIQMPLMGGMEACKLIRRLYNANARAPILAMTAHMFDEEQLLFYQSGMNAAIQKPIEKQVLVSLLQRMLSASSTPGTVRPVPQPTLADPQLQIDLEYLRSVSNGNPEFIGMMLDSFLRNAQELQQQLQVAVDHNDIQVIVSIAHQLRFSLGVLGVSALNEKFEWMQQHAQVTAPDDIAWFMQRSRRLQQKLSVLCEQATHLRRQAEY